MKKLLQFNVRLFFENNKKIKYWLLLSFILILIIGNSTCSDNEDCGHLSSTKNWQKKEILEHNARSALDMYSKRSRSQRNE